MKENNTFGARLKELRSKAKISQQELSKILGISKSSINMYERDEREPGIETIKAFADYFNVSTDYLLGQNAPQKSIKEVKKYGLTDEQVEAEIARLNASEAVALARHEQRLKFRRRQYLYQLRDYEKKGKALLAAGMTREVLDALYRGETESELN
ncbi:MAG: helix-turn-helix transcriptional regulator [Clostridia bacterium]|nr:helix-turn-helix transcriptional regulator [Clostridia bacterium]